MRPRKRNRHLPSCIYLSHGAYYLVRDGKWIPLGKDLAGAIAEYGRRMAQPKNGMATLIDSALAHLAVGKSPNTVAQHRRLGKSLRKIFSDFTPEQVEPRHVAKVKVSLSKTPFRANQLVSLLRSIFALAVDWQIVPSNPCVGLRRLEQPKRTRYITDAEYMRIRTAAVPLVQAVMDLCYLTGQRIGDVLAIRHEDLLDEGIRFQQQKTGAKLLVRWTPDLRAAVTRAKALGGNVRALTLFHTRRGTPPSYQFVKQKWDAARTAAGIPTARIHDLRAKALTDAKREGKDAQALGGHTSEKQTADYIRLRETPSVDGPSFRRLLGTDEKAS